ncbi:MAG TPA: AMP-binding protein [Planctomycetaceae bacterium]
MQLESFLEQSARRLPNKVALVFGEQRLTYAEIETRANRLAHALIASGVERGDRIAIFLDNGVEAVVSVFAVLKAGAVFVMVNPTTKAEKLTWILNNCQAKALVAPASKLPVLDDCWSQTPYLACVFLTGGANAAVAGNAAKQFFDLDALSCTESAVAELVRVPSCSAVDGNSHEFIYAAVAGNSHEFLYAAGTQPPAKRAIDIDLAALIYTSGSTGNPKGVMLTHLNMVSAATSITTYLANREDDVILSVLPLSFDYGLYQALMAFKIGATLVLERSFTYPHAVLERLIREKVTGFPLVPTMAAILLQMDLSKYEFSYLRYITNTAAALPVEHIKKLRALFPQVTLFSMYGLTECKRVSYLPPDQLDIRPNSVGKGMPNEEVFVVDADGRRVAAGVVGELVVRGANVMKGYWDLAEETANKLRPGPVPGEMMLFTGDLFRTDAEGFLYFVGRKDDIIKSRGEKVSPKEVENVLCSHPAVAEAAVIGVPDAVLGEAIKAVVTLRPDSQATEKEILRFCSQHLEDFMVPKFMEIREALPKTSNGKVNKRELAGVA